MGIYFTPQDGEALYDLLSEQTEDFIVKTDRDGFIVHGMAALARLGVPGLGALIGPHIADLAAAHHAHEIRSRHRDLMAGEVQGAQGGWIEFQAATGHANGPWYALQMRALAGAEGVCIGTVGIMRSIDDRRSLEDRLFASSMTDPLTGLTNRRAFTMMLQHLIDRGINGSIVLFDIDHFRAINMQHGQSVGDEVLQVFAEFLRVMCRSSEILSRVDGESFAILLPYHAVAEARALGQPILDTLEDIRRSLPGKGVAITASGGVAAIGTTVDETMREAELALFHAKSRGGGILETAGQRPSLRLASYAPELRAARG